MNRKGEAMSDIFYRPNLGLDKNYLTDGSINFQTEEDQLVNQTESTTTIFEDVMDSLISMRKTISQLPSDLQKNVNTLMSTVEFIFVQIDKDYIVDKPANGGNLQDSNEDGDMVIEYPEADDSLNDDVYWGSDEFKPVVIKTLPSDKIREINKVYCQTLLEITNHYIQKMNRATSKYFAELGTLIGDHEDVRFINSKYTYSVDNISDADLHHISDFIAKSQIIRKQKQKMHAKLFSERESLIKIKSCEVARELWIRYEKEKYVNNNDYSDIQSNMLLNESRLQYEAKMKNNLYELYRYLTSSVKILDECLDIYSRESKAKSILIKKEGIKI